MRVASILLVGALFAATTARAQDDAQVDCKNAMVQRDMNICADRDFQAVDRVLNSTYKAVTTRLDGPGRDRLRLDERGWIVRRDKQCDAEAAEERGGSIYPMVLSECLTEKTRARIKVLKAQ